MDARSSWSVLSGIVPGVSMMMWNRMRRHVRTPVVCVIVVADPATELVKDRFARIDLTAFAKLLIGYASRARDSVCSNRSHPGEE